MDNQSLPGAEAMGWGYDVYGQYASTTSCIRPLFDWRKADKKPVPFDPDFTLPTCIDAKSNDINTIEKTTGKSISKYQSSLAVSVGFSASYGLFSGSIDTDFSSSSVRNSENEFSKITQVIYAWSLVLTPDYSELRKYLSEPAAQAIDDATTDSTIESLFNNYGAYFLNGIVVGGKAQYSSATNK